MVQVVQVSTWFRRAAEILHLTRELREDSLAQPFQKTKNRDEKTICTHSGVHAAVFGSLFFGGGALLTSGRRQVSVISDDVFLCERKLATCQGLIEHTATAMFVSDSACLQMSVFDFQCFGCI